MNTYKVKDTSFDPLYCKQSKRAANSSEKEDIHISSLCPGGKLLENQVNDLESLTLYHSFKRGCKVSGDKECLGTLLKGETSYSWLTYNEVQEYARDIGSGLLEVVSKNKSSQKEGSMIGIYSQNRVEWDVVNIACCLYGMTLVPCYDTLGAESLSYILAQTEIECLVIDKDTKVDKIINCLQEDSKLKILIVMEEMEQASLEKLRATELKVIPFSELRLKGANNRQEEVVPDPDQPFVIMYTSGTTGNPKGVVLSHRNIVVDMNSVNYTLRSNNDVTLNSQDVMLSFLPSAHIFNLAVSHGILYSGGRIGYFRGNILQLMDDAKVLKPTFLIVVPRLLNKIYSKIWAMANASPFKKCLITAAYESKKEKLMKTGDHTHFLWDKLVFRKVREILGGQVRLMVTAAAPISAEVLTFMRCSLACTILEGYGQTELSAAATLAWPGDPTAGHVGSQLVCTEIKLDSVPDMNYFHEEGRGEICVRGANCFKGYYKDPKKYCRSNRRKRLGSYW